MAQPPDTSGGGGFTFEDAVTAIYLGALLGKEAAPGLPARVVNHVAVQQRNRGEPLDDVIIDGVAPDGTTSRLGLQVKRSLTVSSAWSNTDFREVVLAAWSTLTKPHFREDIDRVGVVTGTTADAPWRALQDVCEWARASTTAVSFFERFQPDAAGPTRMKALETCRSILSEIEGGGVGDVGVYRVLRHFVPIKFDLLHEGATGDVEAVEKLRRLLRDPGQAEPLWDRLRVLAREAAGRAGEFDRERLIRLLGGNFRLAAGPLEPLASAPLMEAAAGDLRGFQREASWPAHPVPLGLLFRSGSAPETSFSLAELPDEARGLTEATIVAPAGTGKTVTLLQFAELLLGSGTAAVFFPLRAWWVQGGRPLLDSLLQRPLFRYVERAEVDGAATEGQLVLLLDGWDELGADGRDRLRAELFELRRAFPALRTLVSTRWQAPDVPVRGPTIRVQQLSEVQQREIARAVRGDDGEKLVDQAWRTPELRSLIAIPFYLNALLTLVPGGSLPSTKEEILRSFIDEHERAGEHASALKRVLFGCHSVMLSALAVEMTAKSGALPEDTARAAVNRVGIQLVESGKLNPAPQPAAVLDVLAEHHLLLREGGRGGISFQHQQFQEWFGSLEVETVLRSSGGGDEAARERLRAEFLDRREWEEAVLFACERISREGKEGAQLIGGAILAALDVDPLLAAEMVYRSSTEAWDQVRASVPERIRKWHTPGRADRAVRFMITSGREEFAPEIWALLTNPDSQVYLPTLRAGRRFRPSVLGPDAAKCLASLPDASRPHIVAEIASYSGYDGMDLAAEVAKGDPNPDVQVEVIEALQFRRGDRHISALLKTAPPPVWEKLAAKGYADEVEDDGARRRLQEIQQHQAQRSQSPADRLRLLLQSTDGPAIVGPQIAEQIAAADYPLKDQHAGWLPSQAYERFPDDVAAGLVRRLELGLDLPFRADEMLAGVQTVDAGPVAAAAENVDGNKRNGHAAGVIAGPRTVGRIVDALFAARSEATAEQGPKAAAARERYHQLLDRAAAARPASLVTAVLEREGKPCTEEIAVLADLLARQGVFDAASSPLLPAGDLRDKLVVRLREWTAVLLVSETATRYHFAELARAIGRVGARELLDDLHRLLDEDLKRWRTSRDAYRAQLARGVPAMSDAHMSYVLQYRQAFIAVGGDEVAAAMHGYLEDPDFGIDAAWVLRAIWEQHHGISNQRGFGGGRSDFSVVKVRREQKQVKTQVEASEAATSIFNAAGRLLAGDADAQMRALGLATVGLGLPYGNQDDVIQRLLALPRPTRVKLQLLMALTLAGEIVTADLVLDGIREFVEEAKTETWMLQQNQWELESWIELLPLTDRPKATIEGVSLAQEAIGRPVRMEQVIRSLAAAPGAEAERTLGDVAQAFPALGAEYAWTKAFLDRGSVSSIGMLLDRLGENGWAGDRRHSDAWAIGRELGTAVRGNSELMAELLRWYPTAVGSAREVVEHAIVELGIPEGVLVLARDRARRGQPYDGVLLRAIREAGLAEEPVGGSSGFHELHPVPLTALRRDLFAMLTGSPAEAAIAKACLTAIDELRDDYGAPEFEPRHPDIASGRPWPLTTAET